MHLTSLTTYLTFYSTRRREPELKGSFKALRDRGIKITNYEEHIPK
jgi:hypothetical protein